MFVTNKERLKRNWLKETPTISYTFICSINTKLNAPKLLVLLMWKLGLKEMLRRWWYTKSRSRTEMVNYRKMSSGLIYEQFKTKDLINSVKVLCCQWWTFSVCGIVLNQINRNKKTATICIGKNVWEIEMTSGILTQMKIVEALVLFNHKQQTRQD